MERKSPTHGKIGEKTSSPPASPGSPSSPGAGEDVVGTVTDTRNIYTKRRHNSSIDKGHDFLLKSPSEAKQEFNPKKIMNIRVTPTQPQMPKDKDTDQVPEPISIDQQVGRVKATASIIMVAWSHITVIQTEMCYSFHAARRSVNASDGVLLLPGLVCPFSDPSNIAAIPHSSFQVFALKYNSTGELLAAGFGSGIVRVYNCKGECMFAMNQAMSGSSNQLPATAVTFRPHSEVRKGFPRGVPSMFVAYNC